MLGVIIRGLIDTRSAFPSRTPTSTTTRSHAARRRCGQPGRNVKQTNHLVVELLIPKPMLAQYGCLTPEGIAELCNVSRHAARIWAEELG